MIVLGPVNHIGTSCVSPRHVAPNGGLRIVLEEEVIELAVVDHAVRIIKPIALGAKMELRSQRLVISLIRICRG